MSTPQNPDPFESKTILKTRFGECAFFRLRKLTDDGLGQIDRLPFCMKVLLENVLRHAGGEHVEVDLVRRLAAWNAESPVEEELPFMPARVVLQDFTGVPAVVDLAAMRSALVRLGGDPRQIQPCIPVDLVIDHSVQVDRFGTADSLSLNQDIEFARNRERYEFLRWGRQAFDDFRVVPPATGIVHQVNLEYLAQVVMTRKINGQVLAFPDTLVGMDSHTTMINGLSVMGWGVGGIEAEACMLGEPITLLTPQVVGFKLNGRLPEGATATDLVLTVTQMLRSKGVVGKFVEFFGDGLAELSLPDRATLANMSPEYGATMGFFPIDDETLRFLSRTGRSTEQVDLVERYAKEQGLFRFDGMADPIFTDSVFLELETVEPCLAGPKRPQDRIRLGDMKKAFRTALTAPPQERGFGLSMPDLVQRAKITIENQTQEIGHGAVIIAAITSCTNTSNPSVMIAAGLLAKKAVQYGLTVKPTVKTSLAPGSRVVTDYLHKAGLDDYLEKLGFFTVGYGCTTCIGNSGPLPEPIVSAVRENNLVAASVLSGNRNFEGRISPDVKANYLASPPLVVAYALAGRADIDLTSEPLGCNAEGKKIYLRDLWPSRAEITEVLRECVTPEMFKQRYADVFNGNETWNAIPVAESAVYDWSEDSTYIQEPPFFESLSPEPQPIRPIENARVMVMVGDSVTTDHISPAGAIAPDSPAGCYLREHHIEPQDFNSYGSRRGNDRVMTRGTFANVRLRNLLAPGSEGGVTRYLPTGEQMSIYDASLRYQQNKTPLIVLAGAEYGTGSSRDWAAKGTQLLGVRAVIAVSYERIHRSNLVFMGVLPLQFADGENRESLGLSGEEIFTIEDLSDDLKPGQTVSVIARSPDGERIDRSFKAVVRIDTPIEIDYYRNGGILHTVLRKLLKK